MHTRMATLFLIGCFVVVNSETPKCASAWTLERSCCYLATSDCAVKPNEPIARELEINQRISILLPFNLPGVGEALSFKGKTQAESLKLGLTYLPAGAKSGDMAKFDIIGKAKGYAHVLNTVWYGEKREECEPKNSCVTRTYQWLVHVTDEEAKCDSRGTTLPDCWVRADNEIEYEEAKYLNTAAATANTPAADASSTKANANATAVNANTAAGEEAQQEKNSDAPLSSVATIATPIIFNLLAVFFHCFLAAF